MSFAKCGILGAQLVQTGEMADLASRLLTGLEASFAACGKNPRYFYHVMRSARSVPGSSSRNLEGFARLLSTMSEWSEQFLDLAKVATAAHVSRVSAGRWFEVLEDTLLVLRADAFAKSATRRLMQHPKFYFFDVGVLNGLLGNFVASPDRIGVLFEHLVWRTVCYRSEGIAKGRAV